MFFGKSRKRKSWHVGTPEYEQYEELDNRQDMYDLQKRMREHGFEGGPGINKDRWTYKDDIFDINKPGGPAAEVWDMPDEEYEKLIALLDKLDGDKTNVSSIANALTVNDVGRSFDVTETREDTDGDGDVDKVEIEKKEE